jgi:kumamolisin
VQPLYKRGVSGKGRTLGIVTLANFTPSDVFAYWSGAGLTVDPNRLQIVNIDGGPGAPSDASDSLETTLDVEQSGGVAPCAKIIVYLAPNTFQAFVDAFAAAVESNSAETLSTSWGAWEWYANLENAPVTDPTTGKTVAQSGEAYKGPHAPLHAIAYGDNWFYYGSKGYNLGAGLGTLDVANFADFLSELF